MNGQTVAYRARGDEQWWKTRRSLGGIPKPTDLPLGPHDPRAVEQGWAEGLSLPAVYLSLFRSGLEFWGKMLIL